MARLDRFTRSSADLHAILAILQARGAMVTFLDNPAMNLDTAHGELLLGILAATASFERRLILARTAEGRARAKVRGVKFGRPSVISDKVVKRITKLRAEGNVSASEIASEVGVSRRTVYRAIAEK